MKSLKTNCPNIQFESRLNQWAEVLFDSTDLICNTNTPYGTSLINMDHIFTQVYTSINAMVESRKDSNVVKYRSILLEFDKHSIKKQLNFIKKSGLPYTSLVFSGGKSIHCILTLQEPLNGREEYDELVNDIYFLMDPKEMWLDKSCRNPSRLTRTPTAIRMKDDIEVEQSLIELKSRVSMNELLQWKFSHKNYRKLLQLKGSLAVSKTLNNIVAAFNEVHPSHTLINEGKLNKVSRRAEAFLNYGASDNWLNECFYTACELTRSNWDFEEIHSAILNIDGYLDAAAETAINNAFKKARVAAMYEIVK